MVERVRNHMIRKAVDDVEDTDGGSDCPNTPAEELDDRFTPPSAQLPQAQAVNTASAYHPRQRPTCDGPAIALMFRKFVELFDEMPSLDNDEGSKQRCCDVCRPLVARRSAILHSELEKWAAELEDVRSHTSRGDEIVPSREHNISPLKQAPRKSPLVPIHNSDSGGSTI
jgi:hypothetical protein